jgi:hypothetical protein
MVETYTVSEALDIPTYWHAWLSEKTSLHSVASVSTRLKFLQIEYLLNLYRLRTHEPNKELTWERVILTESYSAIEEILNVYVTRISTMILKTYRHFTIPWNQLNPFRNFVSLFSKV